MATDLREQLQLTLGAAYVLERELGGGGMSRVFVARDISLEREVVVKVLLPELAAGMSVERFRREILLSAKLQHPHIVPVHTAGESNGLPYFIMPYVDGESLRARLARDGELPISNAVRILRDVASALNYAHTRGVVHRDIKPDNVLLSSGVAVVTDFGVAKALTVSASTAHTGGTSSSSTSIGLALGTPNYMAPEQATADPAMDHRVDIYAFGVMAYEMLTGQPPFTNRSPQAVLAAHVTEDPEPLEHHRPSVPPQLEALVMRCLEKHPADRQQSAGEIMQALDAMATPSGGTSPTGAVRSSSKRRPVAVAPAPRRSRRYLPIALAFVVIAGVVFAMLDPARFVRGLATEAGSARPAVSLAPDTLAVARADSNPAAGPDPAPEAPPPKAPERERVTSDPVPPIAPRRTEEPATSESESMLSQLRASALDERQRAVASGATAANLAAGDSVLAAAEALVRSGQRSGAAVQLAQASSLWSSAALAARATASRVPPPTAPKLAVPESARAPTPVTSPAPSAVQPAAPSRDPRPEIRALVSAYSAAIESRSVTQIRRVYPGVTASQEREWSQFFEAVQNVTVTLAITALDVTDNGAEAQLAGEYVYENRSTHRGVRQPVSFHATMQRENGAWRIVGIR